jgi:hypothetical protein
MEDAFAAAAALSQPRFEPVGIGWNALILEGPGQGSNLFLRSQVFIPDWSG